MMSPLRSAPLRYLSLLLGCWLSLFVLTRSLLLVAHWPEAALSLSDLPALYLSGPAYDLGFLACAAVPLALYLLLCPRARWRRHDDALGSRREHPADLDYPLVGHDIAYYQAASYAFSHALLTWNGELPAASFGLNSQAEAIH